MYYLLLNAITATTAAITMTMAAIPAISVALITGLVTVTVVVVAVDVVVVDVVTGVYVVWKYEVTQACNSGSGVGKPMKTAHL